MAKVLINPPPPKPKRQNDFPIHLVGPDGQRHRRVIPLTQRQRDKVRQWEIDYRFVREVERLERDGRVEKRVKLELAVGLEAGAIASIRNGMRGVSPANIALLFENFRCDMHHILLGSNLDLELSKAFIPGLGRLNIYEPYYHRYVNTARFRVGPRPETLTPHPTDKNLRFSAYWPDDPDNEQWTAPPRMSIANFMGLKGAEATTEDTDDE